MELSSRFGDFTFCPLYTYEKKDSMHIAIKGGIFSEAILKSRWLLEA